MNSVEAEKIFCSKTSFSRFLVGTLKLKLRYCFVLPVAFMLSSCASLDGASVPDFSVPEVNGYVLKSRTTIYGDGRARTWTYSVDMAARRIYNNELGDYHEFNQHGAITAFFYGSNGSKIRRYFRDGNLNVIKTAGTVSGKRNIDSEYKYRYSKLVTSADIYTSGNRYPVVNYRYDAGGRLESSMSFYGSKQHICNYKYKRLVEFNKEEVLFECGKKGPDGNIDEVTIHRRRHRDEHGNVTDYFLDDNAEKFGNTQNAKHNAFRITYVYEKTDQKVPNIISFRRILNPGL